MHPDGDYESYEQRSKNSESLLPYWAPGAWIARGVTTYAKHWYGQVTLDRTTLRLDDEESKILVEANPTEARLRSVPIWFGMGVCIDFGTQGKWYVQPRYSPTSPRRARRATAVFERALHEAGAE